MSVEAQSVDADESGEEEFEAIPQAQQTPHTIIVGNIVDVRAAVPIDSEVEDTGHDVGVVFENPTIARGSLWQNRNIPEGFDSAAEYNRALKVALAEDGEWVQGTQVDENDVSSSRDRLASVVDVDYENDSYRDHNLDVDYRVADTDDRDAEVKTVEFNGEEKTTGIALDGREFESNRVEEVEHDKIMVWFGGITGQFVLRALDFHGRPSARYNSDGYLVPGVLQHPLGWFDRDEKNYEVETTDRSELARDPSRGGLGRPPRVVRPPILRDDIRGEEVFVEIDRYGGGNMYEVTTAFNDFESDPANATEIGLSYASADEIEGDASWNVNRNPYDVIEEELGSDFELATYHGDGWQPKVDAADEPEEDTSGGSFDVDVDTGSVDEDSSVEHPTDNEVEFGEMVSEGLAGTNAKPSMEVFNTPDGKVDLETFVGMNEGEFDADPDVSAIREVVYENVDHLSVDDL